MDYAAFTTDKRRAALAARLEQLERQHFELSTDKELFIGSGATDQATLDAIKKTDAELAILDTAHADVQRLIVDLGPTSYGLER